jgi:hypothetical protein
MRAGIHLSTLTVAAVVTATAAAGVPAAIAAPNAGAVRTGTAPVAAPAWHTVRAGRLTSTADLFDVTTAGANAAWAVGIQTVDGATQGVILHWNGTAWRRQATPDVPATATWEAVSAASAHDVWAYGWDQTRETLAHYDGTRWKNVDLPALPDGQIYGFAELAAVPGTLWVATDSAIAAYSGGTWTSTALPASTFISSVQARSATDAWAVGQRVSGLTSRPVALHWDGRAWQDVSPTGTGTGLQLTDVYQESARSVWATEVTTATEDTPRQTRVLHWDGHGWLDATGPQLDLGSSVVSGDGKGTVWVSGDPNGYEGPAVYWRLRHGVWTSVPGDTVPGGVTQSYDVTDLAPIGSTGRFWSVGSYELIVGESTSATYELIQRSPR